MKKAKILLAYYYCAFRPPLISQAATLDVRGGYRSGSHAYETRLKVSEDGKMDGGQAWKVIPGIPIHDNKKENAALNDVQVEVNYAIKLDDQWTVRPGMLTHLAATAHVTDLRKLSWTRQRS